MKGNFLEREYFYDSNMQKDDKVAIVGNCLEQLIAIILKNTYIEEIDYYSMAIEDLSFRVRYDKEGYFIRSALKCNETGIEKNLWNIDKRIIIGDEVEAKKALDYSLSTYGYAIVRTADGHLEFSKNFDETCINNDTFDYKAFPENGHVILIIGEDEENYFYIDQPNEINMNNYTHAKGRRDIGVYPKKKFMEAFRRYLCLFFIEFNEKRIRNPDELGSQIIKKSVDNFYNNYFGCAPENDSYDILGGRAALYKLSKMLEQKKMVLNKKVFNPTVMTYKNYTIGEEFLNGMTSIINRREVIKGYFSKKNCCETALEEDLNMWKRAKEIVLYQCSRGDIVLRKEDIGFEQIIEAEEKLFDVLSTYLENEGNPG